MFVPKQTAVDVATILQKGLLNGTIILSKEEPIMPSVPRKASTFEETRATRLLVWPVQLVFTAVTLVLFAFHGLANLTTAFVGRHRDRGGRQE